MLAADYCIVGGGVVGGILGYYLYRGDPSSKIAMVFRRREAAEAVRRRGGFEVVLGGEGYLYPVEPVADPGGWLSCDVVFNAVKAYDVPESLRVVRSVARRGSTVIMLQNGFGSLEEAEEALPDLDVAAGVVYFGGTRLGDGRVAHGGGNSVVMGCRRGLCPGLLRVASVLRRGGCDARVVGNVDFYRWLKLGVNSVINPLTAIARAPNEVLLSEPAKALAEWIAAEVAEAARLNGVPLDGRLLLKHALAAAAETRRNYSSMAQDVMSGRRTEVDYINGFVARELAKAGRVISANAVITQLVKMLEGLYAGEGHREGHSQEKGS